MKEINKIPAQLKTRHLFCGFLYSWWLERWPCKDESTALVVWGRLTVIVGGGVTTPIYLTAFICLYTGLITYEIDD